MLLSKTVEPQNGLVVLSDLENLNLGVYLLSIAQNNPRLVKQLIYRFRFKI